MEKLICENRLYTVGVDCSTGYYIFINQFASEYNAKFHKYTIYPPVGSHQCTHGFFGCTYISDKVKFIEIENGTAMYYGEKPFKLFDILFQSEYSSQEFNSKVYSNDITEISLYSTDLKRQYFSGAESGILSKQCICAINNRLLWVGLIDINSYKNSSLLQIGIKNNTTNKIYTYGKKGLREAGNQEFNFDYLYNDINSSYIYNDKNNDKYWYLIELPIDTDPNDEIQLDWIKCNKSKKRIKKAENTFVDTYINEILRLKKILYLYTSYGIELDIESEINLFEKAPDSFELCIKFLKDKWKEKKKIDRSKLDVCEFTFHVGMSYDKQYYCAAKLADNAKRVVKDSKRSVYYVTYDSKQIEEIVLMYYNLRTIFNADKTYMMDISNFINRSVFEEYLQTEIQLYIAQSRIEYGYYNFIADSILVRIQERISEKKKHKLNLLYSEMIKEKRVPTKWSNEYKLFSIISNFVDGTIYQYRPSWLGNQSFDIFLPSNNIAIEYQGKQHYEPVSFFGGDESLEENQKRDERKRNLAEINDVKIIEWRYDMPVNDENVFAFFASNHINVSNKNNKQDLNDNLANGLVMAPVQSYADNKKQIKKQKPNAIKRMSPNVIRQYDTDGVFLKEFDTVSIAAKYCSISEHSITKCIYGQRKTGGGFLWKRVERSSARSNIEILVINKLDNTAKVILQYDNQENFIAEYPSLRNATLNTGVNSRSISDVLKGVQKTAGGFKWKYK